MLHFFGVYGLQEVSVIKEHYSELKLFLINQEVWYHILHFKNLLKFSKVFQSKKKKKTHFYKTAI